MLFENQLLYAHHFYLIGIHHAHLYGFSFILPFGAFLVQIAVFFQQTQAVNIVPIKP